jgi:hypothetical protein
MKKIAFVHYMPLEFYPPITNLLDILPTSDVKVQIWSTKNNKGRPTYTNDQIGKISRASFPNSNDPIVLRLFKYAWFNIKCFMGLLIYNPAVIIYYESYSAYPVYLYYLIYRNRKKYLVHHHEYESPEDYDKGMKVVKYYHALEKRELYSAASWISQTNGDRLRLFTQDNPTLSRDILKILPNYPPQKWLEYKKPNQNSSSNPIKIVYVGALSLADTYIREFCEWVIAQDGKVIFDIYAYNLHADTVDYLQNLDSAEITFYGNGVAYEDLPKVLSDYHIGVILYKAKTKNYQYNAPNKLFEYLASGLRVIYPEQMLGVVPYRSPRVIPVDFLYLPPFEVIKEIQKTGKEIFDLSYFAEEACTPLIRELQK